MNRPRVARLVLIFAALTTQAGTTENSIDEVKAVPGEAVTAEALIDMTDRRAVQAYVFSAALDAAADRAALRIVDVRPTPEILSGFRSRLLN